MLLKISPISYVQILQLQTSPDQFLMFLIKAKTVLLLLITSGALFQSMLPLNDIEFMQKDVINALGNARTSLTLKLQLISFLANNSDKKEGFDHGGSYRLQT